MTNPRLPFLIVGGTIAALVAASVSVVSIASTATVMAGVTGVDATTAPAPSVSSAAPVTGGQQAADGPALWKGASYSSPLTYLNRDGVLVEQQSGTAADPQLASVWSLLTAIAGPDATSIVDVAVSDDTDEATDASVARDEDDPTLWHAEINMASAAERGYLTRTLVHEYGHIASLSTRDVAEVSGSCPAFRFSEGCVATGSVLGRFLDTFWASDEAGAEDEGASEDAVQKRYEQSGGPQSYVSEYAATNGAEDFAETFSNFVMGPETDVPSGSVAQSKLDFFAADASMAALRERILAALAAR